MTYDPQTEARILRARINLDRPNSKALELILEAALQAAFEAACTPGKLNPKQEQRAINVLCFAADGCAFAMSRAWKGGSCKEDNGRGFNCTACEAREILTELGFTLNSHGHWDAPV